MPHKHGRKANAGRNKPVKRHETKGGDETELFHGSGKWAKTREEEKRDSAAARSEGVNQAAGRGGARTSISLVMSNLGALSVFTLRMNTSLSG